MAERMRSFFIFDRMSLLDRIEDLFDDEDDRACLVLVVELLLCLFRGLIVLLLFSFCDGTIFREFFAAKLLEWSNESSIEVSQLKVSLLFSPSDAGKFHPGAFVLRI